MTLAEIEIDLLEYADFEEVLDVSRARLFLTAAKRWLILAADSSSSQSQSMSIGKNFVESMAKRAQDFIAARSSKGSTRFLGVGSNFR